MSERWSPGDVVALRDVVASPPGAPRRVWSARAARVVRDTDGLLALAVTEGAEARVLEGYDVEPRGEPRTEIYDALARGDWSLREHAWHSTHALVLLEPAVHYSVMLFFKPRDGAFVCWYVNFQEPFRCGPRSVDTYDLALDLVVGPDRRWGWKDEEEFELARERGLVTREQAERVGAARGEVLARVEAAAAPFDATWTSWRPEPHRSPARLPADWDRVED